MIFNYKHFSNRMGFKLASCNITRNALARVIMCDTILLYYQIQIKNLYVHWHAILLPT